MAQETRAFELEAEALAQGSSGQTVDRTRRILAIQNESIGEQPLDGARIDIGLIRDIAPGPKAAPIPHQQMRILMLHGPTYP